MSEMSQKEREIILIVLEKGAMRSSAIYAELIKKGAKTSLITVKRMLSEMQSQGALTILGRGRATNYLVSALGRTFADINSHQYCAIEPDKRFGTKSFNFELLQNIPSEIFSDDELKQLDIATQEYWQRTKHIPVSIQKKELERLVIELAWKSSKIEGNTYTLLDTERLILKNEEPVGHDKKEAIMIINHKNAFNFIHENHEFFKTLNRANLEKLHSILVKDMSVGLGLRQKPVGITGSKYKPLDNFHQISEAVEELSATILKMKSPYAKSLMALLGISYIQPFEDGNKRTSRLMANALLLAHRCAPLSYRSVDENEYREATIVFYEINSITPFKKIFIDQYDFAARNYTTR
ncbi:MAG TPA: Fic family protein [Candidatus Paceibacterota bacterium]